MQKPEQIICSRRILLSSMFLWIPRNYIVHKRRADNQHEPGSVLVWSERFAACAVADASVLTGPVVKFVKCVFETGVEL